MVVESEMAVEVTELREPRRHSSMDLMRLDLMQPQCSSAILLVNPRLAGLLVRCLADRLRQRLRQRS